MNGALLLAVTLRTREPSNPVNYLFCVSLYFDWQHIIAMYSKFCFQDLLSLFRHQITVFDI
jgi:hypothetical protein